MPITEYDQGQKEQKVILNLQKEFLKLNEEEKKAKHMM